jgi:hypothetical protein
MGDRRRTGLVGILLAVTAASCMQGATGTPAPPSSTVPAGSNLGTDPTAAPSFTSASTSPGAIVPPTASPTPSPTGTPAATPHRPKFEVGLLLTTVADRVRVRSKPGSVVLVTASGDYSNEAWYCGGGSDSETGVGALGSGPVSGSAEIETRITVGARGVGRATLRLAGDLPAETCPATSPYGPFPMQGRWTPST